MITSSVDRHSARDFRTFRTRFQEQAGFRCHLSRDYLLEVLRRAREDCPTQAEGEGLRVEVVAYLRHRRAMGFPPMVKTSMKERAA